MTDLKLEIEQLIDKKIAERLFPACVVGVITPQQDLVIAGGTYTYDDKRQVNVDSIFDVASLTKVIPTSCLALKLIEDKKLGLKDDIRIYLPEYKNPLSIWDLLTQSVYYEYGFPLSSLAHKSGDEILKIIFNAPLRTSRSTHHYTNTSSILLGLVIEKVYGLDLAAAAAKTFFEPLEMSRTGFDPANIAKASEIVPTEVDKDGNAIHGIVHDESTRAFAPKPVGSAGLFSSAPDLLKFTGMLLNGGELHGMRYFRSETIQRIGRNQLTGPETTGLGWELSQPRFMGRFAEGTFGKTGFTGCLILVNLKLKTSIVILSNHIYPKRPGSFEPINRFRREAADLVFGSAAR